MSKTDALLKAIAETAAVKPVRVDIPGWDAYVRPLTVAESEGAKEMFDDETKMKGVRYAAHLLCDENGVRLLDPNNQAHIAALASLTYESLNKISAAADALNGDSKKSVDAVGKP